MIMERIEELRLAIRMLMGAHYYLMGNPRFWYDDALIEASKIICVTASDMRVELRRLEASL